MNYKKTIRLLEPHGGWGISSEYYNKNITNSNYKIILIMIRVFVIEFFIGKLYITQLLKQMMMKYI